MPFADLRAFLQALEAERQLACVRVEVDPRFELAAICRKALADGGPGLLFENVKGSRHAFAANLLASRERMAIALGVEPDALLPYWRDRGGDLVNPVIVADGACQEEVLVGDDVDFGRFGLPIWNAEDGGPYVTFPCFISQNPTTGGFDCGMYRAQVFDGRTLGFNAGPHRHLTMNRSRSADPDGQFPVAIALGLDPVVQIATVAGLPYGVSELALAGALRGAPVELVRCKTVPLVAPATAEIVLEGYITQSIREEGPFGEFHGYYGEAGPRPVIELSAITCRHDAIHQEAYEGRPPHEDAVMQGIASACEIFRQVQLAGIKAVHITPHSGGHLHCVVSVKKPVDSYAKMVGMGILGCWAGRNVKVVTVVDDDVDVYDPGEVEWAVATRVDYGQDVEIIRGTTGIPLDPSVPPGDRERQNARVSKMIVDATRTRAGSFPREATPPADVVERVLREWSTYGIS